MATYLWSAITNGQNIVFDKANDVLSFNNANISAGNILVGWGSGTKVTFTTTVNGVKKEFTLDVVGAGKGLTTGNVTFQNGSLLYVGDNATGTANDNLGHSFLGHTTAGDRFLLLGGNDTMNGRGGDDVFVLNNGSGNFGADSVVGGSGSDWIGVGFASNTPSGSTINFNLGTLTTAYGTATFSGIENAFGTIHDDFIFGAELARPVTGMQTGANADFTRIMEGYSGDDFIRGDARDGTFEMVRYSSAPSAVFVNLAEGFATDGYDSDSGTAGVQAYTDTLQFIDAVQGSAFNDTLLGGGSSTTFNGGFFESFEGMKGNDSLSGNGAFNVRADYANSPAAVLVDLAKGTAQDGWGTNDILVGINIARGGNFNDTLLGNGFNNQFEGRAGNDSIVGGDGFDAVVWQNASTGIAATLAAEGAVTTVDATAAGLGIDKLSGIEGLRGGDYNDSLTGNAGNNSLEGRAGADLLKGGAGVDLVRYDASLGAVTVNLVTNTAQDGHDSNFGTAGIQSYTDTLQAIENVRGSKFNDTITGNTGDNTIEGWAGNDQLDGGDGFDALDFLNSPDGVVASLAAVSYDGWGGSDVVSNFEKLFGSNFDDSLTGDAGENYLDGRAGVDTLTGGDADDSYVVDDSEDQVIEADDYDGGIDDVSASVSYRLGGSTETLLLLGSANLNGRGNELANFIQGNTGSNHLYGMDGTDNLDGIAGNDTLDGGAGVDVMTGGAGADVFIWDAADSSVDGGAGLRDSVVVKGTGQSLDLTGAAGDVLMGIEILDLRGSGNNSATVDAVSIDDMSSAGTTYFYVRGNAGDVLTTSDAWTLLAGDQMYNGRLVNFWSNSTNGMRLVVDDAMTFNTVT